MIEQIIMTRWAAAELDELSGVCGGKCVVCAKAEAEVFAADGRVLQDGSVKAGPGGSYLMGGRLDHWDQYTNTRDAMSVM